MHLLFSVSSLCLALLALFFPPLTQNDHTDCDLYKRKARDPKMKRKRKRDEASESELKVIDWKNRLRGATAEDIREESCSPALFPRLLFVVFFWFGDLSLFFVFLSFPSPLSHFLPFLRFVKSVCIRDQLNATVRLSALSLCCTLPVQTESIIGL